MNLFFKADLLGLERSTAKPTLSFLAAFSCSNLSFLGMNSKLVSSGSYPTHLRVVGLYFLA